MRTAAQLPEAEIRTWYSRVLINAEQVEALSWSTSRSLLLIPGMGTSGQNAATGELRPVQDPDVIAAVPGTPWTRSGVWPPKRGDTVTIDVSSDGVTWMRRFNGIADKPRGSSDGTLVVPIIDRIDRFSRLVRILPLQWRMHPQQPDGTLRPTGTHHAHVINSCFERAGFYATIPPLTGTIMRASLMGSLWADIGLLVASSSPGSFDSMRANAEWGPCFRNFSAVWDCTGTANTGATMAFMLPASHTGTTALRWEDSSSATLMQVRVYPSRSVSVIDNDGQTVCALSSWQVGPLVVVRRAGGTVTLSSTPVSGTTQTATGSASTVGGTVSQVRATVDADGRLGAVSMAQAPAMPSSVWSPSALITLSEHITNLDASPLRWDVRADTVLDAIANATQSHWGLDEDGRAVFLPVLGMLDDVPSRTISDKEHIEGPVEWVSDWSATASQVVMTGVAPQIKTAVRPTLNVWQGSGSTMSPGESSVEMIHPTDGEDWLGVQTQSSIVTSGPSGQGAWYGTVLAASVTVAGTGGAEDTDRPATTSEYSAEVVYVDQQTWRVSQSAIGSVAVTPRTGQWGILAPPVRGQNTPIVRCFAVTTWPKITLSSADALNDAPVFQIEAEHWAGDNGVGIVADLYNVVRREVVTFQSVSLGDPDPRLQLADRVTLDLAESLAVTVRGTITAIEDTFDLTSGYTQRVDVFATAAYTESHTWARMERLHRGKSWGQTEADYSTWSQSE